MKNLIKIDSKKYSISAKIYLPEDNLPLKEIIIACHGFAGDKESSAIELLAKEIINYGVGVICFDFPGHGASQTDASNLTISNCMEDINVIENYLHQNYANIPIGIFATSFGAYIALINIAKNSKHYNHIILRSPAIKMANIYRYNLLREPEEDYKKRGFTKLGFERELVIPYTFMQELDNNNIFNIYKNISSMPSIYIVQGDMDDIAPINDTKEFVLLNPKKISLYIIAGADHRMKGPGELDKAINFSKNVILNDGKI